MEINITLTEQELMAVIEKSLDVYGMTGLEFHQVKVIRLDPLVGRKYTLSLTNIPPRPTPPPPPPKPELRYVRT